MYRRPLFPLSILLTVCTCGAVFLAFLIFIGVLWSSHIWPLHTSEELSAFFTSCPKSSQAAFGPRAASRQVVLPSANQGQGERIWAILTLDDASRRARSLERWQKRRYEATADAKANMGNSLLSGSRKTYAGSRPFDLAIDSKLRGCDLVKIKIAMWLLGQTLGPVRSSFSRRPAGQCSSSLRGCSCQPAGVARASRWNRRRFPVSEPCRSYEPYEHPAVCPSRRRMGDRHWSAIGRIWNALASTDEGSDDLSGDRQHPRNPDTCSGTRRSKTRSGTSASTSKTRYSLRSVRRFDHGSGRSAVSGRPLSHPHILIITGMVGVGADGRFRGDHLGKLPLTCQSASTAMHDKKHISRV